MNSCVAQRRLVGAADLLDHVYNNHQLIYRTDIPDSHLFFCMMVSVGFEFQLLFDQLTFLLHTPRYVWYPQNRAGSVDLHY